MGVSFSRKLWFSALVTYSNHLGRFPNSGCQAAPQANYIERSLCGGTQKQYLNLYPQVTPVCGSAGEPLRHNQRQVGGQATSATAEKVALLVRVRVQSF